eukprot:scaffold204_cov113-Isochrysis_galbana.AAC.1
MYHVETFQLPGGPTQVCRQDTEIGSEAPYIVYWIRTGGVSRMWTPDAEACAASTKRPAVTGRACSLRP